MQTRMTAPAPTHARTRSDPSLRCFFNALLRETNHWRLEEQETGAAFAFDLPGGDALWVPCDHVSTTGRHGVTGPCLLVQGDRTTPLDFAQAVEAALETLPASTDESRRTLSRVLQSRRNMQEALAARADDLDRITSEPLDFIAAEGALLVGHSVHPCPKARDLFTDEDARAYAPEFQADFPLQWVAVHPRHVRHHAAAGHHHMDLVRDLARHDATLAGWLDGLGDAWLLPCHPFQLQNWLKEPAVADLLATGEARVLGASDLRWRATSSLRAVHCPDVPWMLKFSLTVKLTNSVRHLQPEELLRGALLADLLDTPEGRAFQARFPELTVLPEPVSAAMTDGDGELLPATGLLWRANPFRGDAARDTEVLATLLQDDPRDGVPRLVKRLRAAGVGDRDGAAQWFDRFLHVAVRPLLLAQADHGVLFGAHQQNIVLSLDGVWPRRAYFRDCQGTGFSPLARRRMGPAMERLERDGALLVDGDATTVLFTYYLFVNTTFNVVSSLAMSGWISEQGLVLHMRRFLERLLDDGVQDDRVIRHLLTAPQLRIKGNFRCTLGALNENTQKDVLALYRPIPNPLRGA